MNIFSKQLLQIRQSQQLQRILASDEAILAQLVEGDNVLVNDGMGRTNYKLTGFPEGTIEQGYCNLIYEYDSIQNSWVVGLLQKI